MTNRLGCKRRIGLVANDDSLCLEIANRASEIGSVPDAQVRSGPVPSGLVFGLRSTVDSSTYLTEYLFNEDLTGGTPVPPRPPGLAH